MISSEKLTQLIIQHLTTAISKNSLLYNETWKIKYTPNNREYHSHVASMKKQAVVYNMSLFEVANYENSMGWPTPTTTDVNLSRTNDPQGYSVRCYERKNRSQNLAIWAQHLTAWRSPKATEDMVSAVRLTSGWLTPKANEICEDPKKSANRLKDRSDMTCTSLSSQAQYLTGWPTPRACENDQGNHDAIANAKSSWLGQNRGATVSTIAKLTGWATPVATPANGTPEQFIERKRKSIEKTGKHMGLVVSDLQMQSMLTVESIVKGNLNPRLSGWLMGFPQEWCNSAILANRNNK